MSNSFFVTPSRAFLVSLVLTIAIFSGFALLPSSLPLGRSPSAPVATTAESDASTRAAAAFAQLPLSFEPNQGQAADDVIFQSYGANYSLHLMSDAVSLRVNQQEQAATNVKLKWLSANAHPQLRGERKLPGVSHYLRGSDESQWKRNVPNYAAVRYEQLYPGVDLVFYGQQQQLEYDFVVAPGADPAAIRFTVEGAQSLRLDLNGDLLMQTANGTIRQQKPVLYQQYGAERREVEGGYRLQGSVVSFDVSDYERSLPLVVDPVLVFAARTTGGDGLTVDAAGNIYLTSIVAGPITNVLVPFNNDVLVRKLNPAGTAVLFSTVVGGSSSDFGNDIALDASGNIYVTGSAASTDFPGSFPMGNSAANPLGQAGGGYCFKTTDQATTWQESGRGLPADNYSSKLRGILFDPRNAQVMYAGNQAQVFKSTNGGESWTVLNGTTLLTGGTIRLPLAVAQDGTVYAANPEALYKSTDGGTTWSRVLQSVDQLEAMAIDPNNAAVLYTGFKNKIFKSQNGGSTWAQATLPEPDFAGSLRLLMNRSNPVTLYAVANKLYRSTDGLTWTPIINFTDKELTTAFFDPINATMYLGTSAGVFKTLDEGKTVSPTGLTSAVNLLIGDPTNGSRLYAATSVDFGVIGRASKIWRSLDSGVTWQAVEGRLQRAAVSALALQPTSNGTLFVGTESYPEAFVLKLNPAGNQLVYASYCGEGFGTSLAVDSGNNVYLTGKFLRGAPVQRIALNGFAAESLGAGFVYKLNAAGTAVVYSSSLYGPGADLALDGSGRVAIVGTDRNGFVSVPIKNGYRTTPLSVDAYLAVLDTQQFGAASLLYSTYFGGEVHDDGVAVAWDKRTGNLYLAGKSDGDVSNQIPLTATGSVYRATVFLAKFDPSKNGAASLLWSGRFGNGVIADMKADSVGNVYLTGSVDSDSAPITPGAYQTAFSAGVCGTRTVCLPQPFCDCNKPPFIGCQFFTVPITCTEAYVTKVAGDGSAVLYSTYLGTTNNETPRALALDADNNLYLTGLGILPTTTGAINDLGADGFLTKLSLGSRLGTVATVSAANYASGDQAPASLVAAFLDTAGTGVDKLAITVADSVGAQREARVLYSGAGQVNFEIPAGTALGAGVVRVKYRETVIASGSLRIASITPGIFAFSGTGRGVAAALIVRVKGDGTQVYESLARYDETLKQWVAVPVDLGPATDKVFLVLFGTGFRAVPNLSRVQLTVGGQAAQVLYAGEQPTLIGLDQINALLPRTLIGRGEMDIATTIDGKAANVVRVAIK